MDPLMKRFWPVVLSLMLMLSACGAPAATPAPAAATALPSLPGLPFVVTLTPRTLPLASPTALRYTEPPALLPLQSTDVPFATLTATEPPPTSTARPTFTPVLPTPTETLLPPLELPTEKPLAPALVAWTGLPTYLGDSDPGLLFRVDYDPDLWAQTEGNFGDIVLGNRQMEYCTITPWAGRGLPVEWKVTHEFRYIGSAAFDVNTVTFNGVVKFVTYVGGDRHVLTGFQVSFNQQPDECLQAAEAIFGTLRSFAAVPTITPTILPISADLPLTPTP